MLTVARPRNTQRYFVPADFNTDSWDAIAPFYEELQQRPIGNVTELEKWLKDWSELQTVLSENHRWIYVSTTVDTSDAKAKEALSNLYMNIYPHITVADNKLKRKYIDSPFLAQLDKDLFYTTIRKERKELEIFREENIPLFSELQLKQSRYDEIAGAQSIVYNGEEITLQQAAVYLKSNNRQQREEVYRLVNERRLKDVDELDNLLSELIQLRHKIAQNAGYTNYVAYRYDELGRFDYNRGDCIRFHESVEELIVPIKSEQLKERRQKLGLDVLKPWDTEVDTSGKPALKPSNSTDDLINKTIECFNRLDPYFAQCITTMKEMNFLDIDSRMHKGPGGYNMTMPETGVPFIFMNAANTEHDLITMVHEGGHAIHTFLAHPLPLYAFKETTSEIAEVASMGMELMSMAHWDVFYNNADDVKRAKENHLSYILGVLSKTCLGDSFQHWLYENPQHTVAERRAKWRELTIRFTGTEVDYTGEEAVLETAYQRILHFYVVPFYYIEYAFAQLGAIALWKNFSADKQASITSYKKALQLGYTKPIPVFYETAGARFDFSKEYIHQLVTFVKSELEKLKG